MDETNKLITETVDKIWSNSNTLRLAQLQQIVTDAIYQAKMHGITAVASELGIVVNKKMSECTEDDL
jgi:hypothetical protein